jgi:hypothetical protein
VPTSEARGSLFQIPGPPEKTKACRDIIEFDNEETTLDKVRTKLDNMSENKAGSGCSSVVEHFS